MENRLQKLEKLFNDLEKEKDYLRFSQKLSSYFYFIETTFPIKDIAESFFASRSIQSRAIQSIYQSILQNTPNTTFPIGPLSFESSGISRFHQRIVEGLKKSGFAEKLEVRLGKEEGNNKICLIGRDVRCYVLRGKNPERFKIVMRLYKKSSGLTASEIALVLYKDEKNKIAQDNIKKQINEINKKFQENCDTKHNIISNKKSGVKNIYLLNTDEFSFFVEK